MNSSPRPRRDGDGRPRGDGRPSDRSSGRPSGRPSSGSRARPTGRSSGAGRSTAGASSRPRRDDDDRRPRRTGDDTERRPRRDSDGSAPRARRYADDGERRPRRDGDDRRPRRRDDDDRSGRPTGRPGSRPGGRSDSRGGSRSGGRPASRSGDRRVAPRRVESEEREPRNEAERRRRAVRARGAGSARKDLEPTRVEREPEQWIDEGPTVREAAVEATERATRSKTRRQPPGELDPTVKATVEETLEPRRAARLGERLLQAQVALEAERFTDARRMARSLVKEMGHVAAVHEVIGLSSYRLGKWRDAATALEIARSLRGRVEDLPVLADCYRAMKRWNRVDEIWLEIREMSPAHEVMAEARMVTAGSLAERGDLRGAIDLMVKSAAIPRRVRPFHLSQWYVLGDLYDRAGNLQKAREMFRRVALHDRDFADVTARLASL